MGRFLMKTEPSVFSIDDLMARPREPWDGVRNYQARNIMRDQMKVDDLVLFYHSNAKPAGVAGVCKVVSAPYPDPTQFDAQSRYYDPKSAPDKPRWTLVDVAFVEKFNDVVSLKELKTVPALAQMKLLARGNRLSVMEVTNDEFDYIVKMGRGK